jgi:hypothetical protein
LVTERGKRPEPKVVFGGTPPLAGLEPHLLGGHGDYRGPSRPIGCRDEARAELATAVAMLREMGMAFWLPEAERRIGA